MIKFHFLLLPRPSTAALEHMDVRADIMARTGDGGSAAGGRKRGKRRGCNGGEECSDGGYFYRLITESAICLAHRRAHRYDFFRSLYMLSMH